MTDAVWRPPCWQCISATPVSDVVFADLNRDFFVKTLFVRVSVKSAAQSETEEKIRLEIGEH